MNSGEALYNELYALRERLRKERRDSTGRDAPICSDESLHAMVKNIPTKLQDFAAIEGIGQRFVEQYGDAFLQITKKYAVAAAGGSGINKDMAQTLRELQKKLVNISKNNRLLFQLKTNYRNSFDLTLVPGIDLEGFIYGRKRVLNLTGSSVKKTDKTFGRLNNIIREVTRDQREKGIYDLYIAYPFVQGMLVGDESFSIRAPLALFPVILEKNGAEIKMTSDDSRDPVFNNTLILASMKIGGNNRPLPDNVIEKCEQGTFFDDIKSFYGAQGITVDGPVSQAIGNYVEYKASEFPSYSSGEMHIVLNAVVGRFPTYSSFIQKDFTTLISGKAINNTLNDLLKNLNEGDFYSEYPLPLSSGELKDKGMEASEKDLTYINSLNSAQENVLTAVNKEDEIVVQGPPGTGKSQVITGLISAAVAEGKTVLMVSEKKTALDVVYSRMGTLSKYCMQIDDTADKDRFYGQIGVMLSIPPESYADDTATVSSDIDRDVGKLSRIADQVYAPNEFGIAPYDLYARDKHYDMGDRATYEKYKSYKEGVNPSLLAVKYDDICELHVKYADQGLMNNLEEYNGILARSPWMSSMKPGLSEYQIGEFRADLERLDAEVEDLGKKGFLARLFSKGKVTRDATSVVNKYFTNYTSKTINDVMDGPNTISDGLSEYRTFSSRDTVYRSLSQNERDYGKDLFALSKKTKVYYGTINDGIYDYIMNEHLQRFDASHADIMQQMQDFGSIVTEMDRKMAQKRQLTKRLLESVLSNDLRYVTESKRRGDIARIVENKRKWSLNKFLNRYGYELFKGIRVWLLTPEVVSEIIPMEMGLFDLLVFDEASQMYVEKGIPSIYRAKKVVVAGDHKQLRPSSLGSGRMTYDEDGEDEDEIPMNSALEEESLLDLARSRYDSILLNFHYRSKYEELIAFSNYAFYGGKLYVSPNIEQPDRPPIEVIRVNGVWEDKSNSEEADKIVSLLKEFMFTRRNNETVGIITFNISQRDLINDRLDEACANDPAFAALVNKESRRFDNGEDVGLFVKNIESVQGDERDVIMFSVGYAKNTDGRLMQRFGWLNARGGENRLNVAISRAKRKIFIVTSFEPEELQVEDLKSEGPKILKKYLQYARAVSNRETAAAQSILQSFVPASESPLDDSCASCPVMEKAYDALIRKGYTVEKNVGIGGYVIDLAVKQDGKYILGIECDGRIYGISANTRERDYHRQKYLESRGWHIHRVWTPGMYKDPDTEIAEIVEAIEMAEHHA